jgi:CDP-paratose 2-epimerase
MSKQVLITGGAGFVGSALGLGLAQRYPDWQITALDFSKKEPKTSVLPMLKSSFWRGLLSSMSF